MSSNHPARRPRYGSMPCRMWEDSKEDGASFVTPSCRALKELCFTLVIIRRCTNWKLPPSQMIGSEMLSLNIFCLLPCWVRHFGSKANLCPWEIVPVQFPRPCGPKEESCIAWRTTAPVIETCALVCQQHDWPSESSHITQPGDQDVATWLGEVGVCLNGASYLQNAAFHIHNHAKTCTKWNGCNRMLIR